MKPRSAHFFKIIINSRSGVTSAAITTYASMKWNNRLRKNARICVQIILCYSIPVSQSFALISTLQNQRSNSLTCINKLKEVKIPLNKLREDVDCYTIEGRGLVPPHLNQNPVTILELHMNSKPFQGSLLVLRFFG